MQGGEGRPPVPVSGQGGQIGVVHLLHHPVVASAAEPLPVGLVAGAQGIQQPRLGRAKTGNGVLAVERCKAGLGAHEQASQPAPLGLALKMRSELIGPALTGKPLACALLAHEAGEGLVQRHVIGHPEPSVRRLMDQQLGQRRLRPIDEGAEQRIVEPAERGIGGDPANEGFQVLPGQALRGTVGGNLGEVAAIGGAADERMAPLARRQGERRGGEDVPNHMAAPKVGEAPVAACGVQAHLRFSEPKHLPGPPQPGLERRRGRRIPQQRIDWLRCPQHPPMPAHGLGVVAKVCAAAQRGQEHRHPWSCARHGQDSSTNPNPK